MATPPRTAGFDDGLKKFGESIDSLIAEAQGAIGIGGQPEAVTTQAFILPLLEALGFDPRKPSQCVPQGRPKSPSGRAGATTLQMPSDYLLVPEHPERMVLEVKPFTVSRGELRHGSGQLDQYMRLHGIRVGLLTNGCVLLVYAHAETSPGQLAAGLVAEYDLAGLKQTNLRDLRFLHRQSFIPRFWLGRLHEGSSSKRQAQQNPVKPAQVPASLLKAVRSHCPDLNNSDIIRSAIRFCEPRFEEVEARRKDYLRRVGAGISMERLGFRLSNDPGVEQLLETLRDRYPLTGPVKGRFGVHTLLGLLVEVWAEAQGVPLPVSP